MKKLFLISFIFLASTAISLAQLKVVPSGKVGIGITSPTTKLHIKDESPLITIENTVTPYKIWQMGITGSDFSIVETGVGSRFFIQNSTGNVGIGTSSPNSLLEVAGLISFTPTTLYNTFLGYNSGTFSTGGYNTATGHNSLYSNTSGYSNNAYGWKAGYYNTSGINNTFSGYQSGYSNTSGAGNTFTGYQSGKANLANYNTFSGGYCGVSNTSGNYNAFFGYQTGYFNTTGSQNTFLGIQAGIINTTGYYNTYIGALAGYNNTTGYFNVYNGWKAGYNNTTGMGNTAIGYGAGLANTKDTNCTFVGNSADANGNYHNSTAIGFGAIAPGSNYVKVGNSAITTSWVQVAWTIGSDARFKFNIIDNVKGLEFINKLRPVTYQMNTQQLDDYIIQNMPDSVKLLHQENIDFAPSSAMVHSGFLAQEVDSAANACGFVSSIVHKPLNNTDIYGLSYEEFVVPLVKAVQELNATVVQQGLEIQALKTRLNDCCKVVTPSTIEGN